MKTILITLISCFSILSLSAQDGSMVIDGASDDPQNIRVDQRPASFPGGQDAMNEFIYETMEYPEEAVKERITGNVGVTFTVDNEGKISNVRLMQPAHELLNAEAIRIIEEMPDWEPAMRNNIAVRSSPVVFITFSL